MNQPIKRLKLLTAISLAACSTSVYATNGLWLPGYGAKSTGMAGTSIAVPHDALAPASNPANIAGMGTRLDMGVGIFNAEARAFVDADGSFFGDNVGEAESGRSWFLIPNFGYTYEVNEKWTVGVAAYGNGLGLFYNNNLYDFTGTSDGQLSVNLMQMLMPLTAAYKISDDFSVGASLVLAGQIFEAKGFESFSSVSADPTKMTGNGFDTSYGAGVRLGITKTFADVITLAGYYASKTYMTEFDEYSGLFAEQGDLDIPSSYGLGIAYKVTDKTLLAFDVVRIEWEGVASIANKGPENYTGTPLGAAAAGVAGQIGADDGMGFGWEDQTIYKIGASYQFSPTLTLTTGFNYGKKPIPDDQLAFGVVGPAVTEKHLAFGMTKQLNGYTIFGGTSAELSISYLHGFLEGQEGVSPLGTNSDGQEFAGYAEYEMVQNQFEISYGLKF